MANVASFYDGPEDKPVREAWVNDFASELRQDDAGAYVNFLGDEGEERVRAAYPGATWDRLARVKAEYDPTNLFRHNQNIPGTAAPAARTSSATRTSSPRPRSPATLSVAPPTSSTASTPTQLARSCRST